MVTPSGPQREALVGEAARRWPAHWQTAVIDAINERRTGGFPVVDYRPDHLVKDRVALVGDAAHATTPISGRGLDIAFEDISVLCRILSDAADNDPRIALQLFENERLPVGRELVDSDRRLRRLITG
ncbi:FAD-dependent oxidoreductase [Kocuria palustris]|uniref:FAD-dependent oxidoreductase n=1 Tax=Kocuria palustris TaxID=71999 RepID=UPI0021A2DA81|nr:FAD-dependent monooxygenase [Kocuria palustris]MCT1591180.1 FAD-dependent monooxygenase [Kocuria palustris]